MSETMQATGPSRRPSIYTGPEYFLYLMVGPLVGLLALQGCLLLAGFLFGQVELRIIALIPFMLPVAYVVGLPTAAVCMILSFLAARWLAEPWQRLAAAVPIGFISGMIGFMLIDAVLAGSTKSGPGLKSTLPVASIFAVVAVVSALVCAILRERAMTRRALSAARTARIAPEA